MHISLLEADLEFAVQTGSISQDGGLQKLPCPGVHLRTNDTVTAACRHQGADPRVHSRDHRIGKLVVTYNGFIQFQIGGDRVGGWSILSRKSRFTNVVHCRCLPPESAGAAT